MPKSADLARSTSADAVLTGSVILVLGLAMDLLGLYLAQDAEPDNGGGALLLTGGVVALVGLLVLGVGLFWVAQKVDDTHRLAVRRHERDEAVSTAQRP